MDDGGQDELSTSLRQLRAAAGLSIRAAAAATGFSGAKISRQERGVNIPSDVDVAKLLTAYRAPAAERRRLVGIARDIRAEHRPVVMPRYARHPSDFQRRLVDIEATTAHLQTFVPTVVPGLMQTEAYMRELLADLELPEEEIRAFVANRVQRQERLHHRTKRTTMLTTEGAFGWRAGSREQMAQQCERAAMVSRLPNVRVGIIPWGTRAHHFPMNGWDLHDQRAVIYGTVDATAILVEPRDVRRYVELTAAVAALAAYDHEARALLAELAQRYREDETRSFSRWRDLYQ
jgi:transcriptional regulator with XRE-family HTH domain